MQVKLNKLFLLVSFALPGALLHCAEEKRVGEQKVGVEAQQVVIKKKISKKVQAELKNKFLEAVRSGSLKEVVGLALDKKDLVNCHDEYGRSALLLATMCEHKDVMEWLLNNGARRNDQDHNGITPLIAAVSAEVPKPAILKILLEHGESPDFKNYKGETALSIADLNRLESIKAILVEYEEIQLYRNASFIKAVELGNLKEIQELINKVDINFRFDRTALMCAVSDAHKEVVEYLLVNKAEPDIRAENGCTALTSAVYWANDNAFYGANHQAKYYGIIELLLKYGADPNFRRFAYGKYSEHAGTGILGFLNFEDASHSRGNEGLSCNHINGLSLRRELLGSIGGSCNDSSCLSTPLMSSKNIEVIQLLLKYGADPDLQDSSGNAVMHNLFLGNSYSAGNSEMVLRYGANPHLKNKNGKTCSMVIAESSDLSGAYKKTELDLLAKYTKFYDKYHANYVKYKNEAIDEFAKVLGSGGVSGDTLDLIKSFADMENQSSRGIMSYEEYINYYEYENPAVEVPKPAAAVSAAGEQKAKEEDCDTSGFSASVIEAAVRLSKEEQTNKELDAALDLMDQDDAQEKSELELKCSGSQACSPPTPEPAAAAAQRAGVVDPIIGQAPRNAFDLGVMLVDQPEEAREYILRLLALNKITGRQ